MYGKKKARLTLDINPHTFYRRAPGDVIFIRDREGRYRCFTVNLAANTVSLLPSGITTLGPLYSRIDFANGVRFTAHTRSQDTMAREYAVVPSTQRLSTGWQDLPAARNVTRRTPRQGMDAAMIALTGVASSATAYAAWFNANHPGTVDAANPWEWCHLLAHSMGGADGPGNVVAAMKGNNSEQLVIENALQLFRHENCFQMKISCALLNTADGRYIGNIIRYKIRSAVGGDYVRYLDCLNAPDPSAIHYFEVLRNFVSWANQKLLLNGAPPVMAQERRIIKQYIEDNS